MGKRSPYTPLSKIKQALRTVWLRSRERAQALKNAGYCCEECGIKQSRAKGKEVFVEVHHRDGIDWEGLLSDIRKRLLPDPSRLKVLCHACHEKEHPKKKAPECPTTGDMGL